MPLFALKRKKRLLLCTHPVNDAYSFVFNGFSDSLSMTRGYELEYISFEEIIFNMSREIVPFDTILTTGSIAKVLAMHINSLNKFPAAYSIYCAENMRIYKREAIPYDTLSNLSYAGLLTACAGMIENELGYKSVGTQLRRAAARALESCATLSAEDFQKRLISELNTPLRNRQVKHNESNN